MAEVIDLKRRKAKEIKRREARARRRAQAVASALSCGLCPRRCSHCGLPIEDLPLGPNEAPYPMCEPCLEEFRAYKRHEGGQEHKDAYWHSDQWQQMWRTWLDAMAASDEFRRSPEFLKLMQENQDES